MLVVHPSDEMYGADRVLIEVLVARPDSAAVVVWLPSDLPYEKRALSRRLGVLGVPATRRRLPVLRRENLTLRGSLALLTSGTSAVIALCRLRPEGVYLNTSAVLLLAWPARLLGIRVVLHVHESWAGLEGKILGILALAADDIICVSAAVRDRLPRGLRDRAVIIHNGFPTPETAVAEPARASAPQITFVVASRWNHWKGLDQLLACWGELQRTDAHLVILGGPPPSGRSVDVPHLVSKLKNGSTVTLVGETHDAASHIASAQCVLVPSQLADPLPTIAIEAAALGKATLASDLGGLPEIILDGVTGRLLPAPDRAAWISALEELDTATAAKMGAAARARYEFMFTPERFRADIARHIWTTR